MAMLLMGCGKGQLQPSTNEPGPRNFSTVDSTTEETTVTDDSAKEASTEVTKTDIDAYILEPAGSTYTLVNYYEDIPALDTKLDDGTVVRIPLSETGFDAKFNGTLIRDLFDELMYVG